MAGYQVAIVRRPADWAPGRPDDVPPQPGEPLELWPKSDGLFAAVGQAIEHNQQAAAHPDRWAVVVEPGAVGRTWPAARLCTPITYQVMALWWPAGWEPDSPLDVPNCVWQAQGYPSEQHLTYQQAENAVGGLNRQAMNQAGSTWYVVAAVENEPLSQTTSYDAAGTETTVQVRRLHVIRPQEGGRGNCAYCPAHSFACAQADWKSQAQAVTVSESRPADVVEWQTRQA